MEGLRKFNVREILVSIVLIALGIIIIVNPETVLGIVVKVLSAGVILDGVWHIFKFFRQTREEKALSLALVQGVAEIFLGIVAIIKSDWVISIIYVVIGLWIAIESILKIQMSLFIRDTLGKWTVALITAILGLIVGILIIANPLMASEYVTVIIGTTMILAEIPNLLVSAYMAIKLKKVDK